MSATESGPLQLKADQLQPTLSRQFQKASNRLDIARSSHFGKAFQGQLSDSNENLEYKYVWVNIQCKW
jgi:hypothetical protein